MPDSTAPLTFADYAAVSRSRAKRWHKGDIDEWSVTDWATALAGEVGELCNAIKKYRRVEDALQGHDGDTPQPQSLDQAVVAIKKEIGDSYAYLDLLAQRFGLTMEDCVRDTFNAISQREGFPEKLPAPPKFREGQVLRYGGGPTALFRVDGIKPNHGGAVRYYGEHCLGGIEGRYESQCELASEEDIRTWEYHAVGRDNTARRSPSGETR
jgi:NTP pyrophosphatase (non-canonical NTP hydrolase)